LQNLLNFEFRNHANQILEWLGCLRVSVLTDRIMTKCTVYAHKIFVFMRF